MEGYICKVKPGSPAAAAGIQAGERLLAVNGVPMRDIIDLSFAAAEEEAELALAGNYARTRTVQIAKEADEDLGLVFSSAVFDGVRTCANRCRFCFVEQLPRGLRPSLYVRDDDYRLSFLYGNFITLTNLGPADHRRIATEHLSPLYVSVHATDPAVRAALLGCPRGGALMEELGRLLAAGVTVHTQVVCCPGINDGEILRRTFEDLYALRPGVADMAVVPVGLTGHRGDLSPLKSFDKASAAALIAEVSKWQRKCRLHAGRTFVYLGDEFYLMAQKPLPQAESYDGYPQLANGIGSSRLFIEEWREAEGAGKSKRKKSAASPAAVVCGELARPVLAPLVKKINGKTGSKHRLLSVKNEFFGGGVTVSGLLTGRDILKAAQGIPEKRLLLPAQVLNDDGLFLDDMTFAAFKESCAACGLSVHTVKSGGQLYELLTEG